MAPATDFQPPPSLLDAADPLAGFRDEFHHPAGQIYFDGNSLGLLCRPAEQALLECLAAWRSSAIGAWTAARPPWFDLAERLGAELAELVGAAADEVIVANSTTLNLHQLLAALYRPAGRRRKIAIDALTFPSNLHALRSHLQLRGLSPDAHVQVWPSADGLTLDEAALERALADDELALAVLPGVVFHSGQLLDVARLAQAGRDHGVTVLFDLSHAAGAVPLALDAWGVDAACWCTYKYLNGGPGSVAAAYLNRRHFGAGGLAGWFTPPPNQRFDWQRPFAPAPTAAGLQISTPHILSMAPLLGSLELLKSAGIARVREKSLALTGLLMDLVDAELAPLGFALGNPREEARRGGHVALLHPEAERMCQALRARNVVPDFRPPRIVRLAPVALYNTFEEVVTVAGHLHAIVTRREFERFAPAAGPVP